MPAPYAHYSGVRAYLYASGVRPTIFWCSDCPAVTMFISSCGETRSGRVMVKRKTQGKSMVRKRKILREEMTRRMHTPIREQHHWLCQVLRGHCQYYGVIFNYRSLRAFKDCVV